MTPPIVKKIALANIEGVTLDWIKDYEDVFPDICDKLHEATVLVEQAREEL